MLSPFPFSSPFPMYDESLLERIRRLEEGPATRGARDISVGIRSVIDHLHRMLNTRQGSVPVADDYGMPDFTNFPADDLAATAADVEHIIASMIEKYEPRLQNVRVRFDPKPEDIYNLRFRLEAEMVNPSERGRAVPVVFETIVTSDGKVNIEH